MDHAAEKLLAKGIAAHNENKFEEAELIYQSILKTNPKNDHTNHNLGVLMFSKNKIEKIKASLPFFETALEVDPNNPQFLMSYSNALYRLNHLKDAEKGYKNVIKFQPENFNAHNNLGTLLHKLSRFDEAIECYKKAIGYKPDFAEAFHNMGATFKMLRKLDECEVAFKQAIMLKSDYADAHSNLGNLYKDLARFKEAVSEYYKVLDIDSNYPQIYYRLINALENEAKSYHLQLFDNISMRVKLDITEPCSNEFIKKEITIDHNVVDILNKLSQAINKLYGLTSLKHSGINLPSINNGPCGIFANEFYKQWNSRFLTPVKICFIMNKYPVGSRHVLIKLPNDKLFDGGVGVHDFKIYNKENLELSIMENYDLQILDKHSWGIFRTVYEECPDFSISEVSTIIKKFLDNIYKS